MRLSLFLVLFLLAEASFGKGATVTIIGTEDKDGNPIKATICSASGVLAPACENQKKGGEKREQDEIRYAKPNTNSPAPVAATSVSKDVDVNGVALEPPPIQLSNDQRESYKQLITAYQAGDSVQVSGSGSPVVGMISSINIRQYGKVSFELKPTPEAAAQKFFLDKIGSSVTVLRLLKKE